MQVYNKNLYYSTPPRALNNLSEQNIGGEKKRESQTKQNNLHRLLIVMLDDKCSRRK